MTIHNYTIPEFKEKYLDSLLNEKMKYEFLSISQLEGYKSSLNYHLDLCLEHSERLEELNAEFIKTRNFLRQESSVFISSFLDILPIIEREGGHTGVPHNETEYQATHSLKSIGNLILDDEPIFREFTFMKHLNLDIDGIERAVVIVKARKQFFKYLKHEIEKMRNPTSNLKGDQIIEYEKLESNTIDKTLVKWNRKKGEFYFFMDSLVESGIISITNTSKKEATEQIARSFGLELADSWQRTKSDEYKAERKLLENGKTTLFKDLVMAFDRLIERRDIINNDKDEKDALVRQEIKAKKSQIK